MLISVSRRTDIPTFYSRWFLKRLNEGRVVTHNPFTGVEEEVSLHPDNLQGFVFWSRNYLPFLSVLQTLEDLKISSLYHYTITGLPREYEERVPSPEWSIEVFQEMARRSSPDRLFWRYDPVVISPSTPMVFHLSRFSALAKALRGYTRFCFIGFVEEYDRKIDPPLPQVSQEEKETLLTLLAGIARENGMEPHATRWEDALPGVVDEASCLHGGELHLPYFSSHPQHRACHVTHHRHLLGQTGQRSSPSTSAVLPLHTGHNEALHLLRCSCEETVDIGAYDSCPHGCSYCFANSSRAMALWRFSTHDPSAPSLPPPARLLKGQVPKPDPAFPRKRSNEVPQACTTCMRKEKCLGVAV